MGKYVSFITLRSIYFAIFDTYLSYYLTDLLSGLRIVTLFNGLNPNKAGLFESSFFWDGGGGGVQIDPLVHICRKSNLISI